MEVLLLVAAGFVIIAFLNRNSSGYLDKLSEEVYPQPAGVVAKQQAEYKFAYEAGLTYAKDQQQSNLPADWQLVGNMVNGWICYIKAIEDYAGGSKCQCIYQDPETGIYAIHEMMFNMIERTCYTAKVITYDKNHNKLSEKAENAAEPINSNTSVEAFHDYLLDGSPYRGEIIYRISQAKSAKDQEALYRNGHEYFIGKHW